MVATIKFSQFDSVTLTNTTNKVVGVSAPSGGVNFQADFTTNWTTTNRPSPPYNGLSGYNSSLDVLEYWNGSDWVQLGSGDTGTVTQIDTGTGLTGGPITTTGTISFGAINANSLWANITGSSAVPTEIPTSTFLISADNLSDVPNKATARTNLGLAIGTNVEAWSALLDEVAAGTWPGATSITTLGTIAFGTWQSTPIGLAYGGTNTNLTATNHALVVGTASGMAFIPLTNSAVLATSNAGVPTWLGPLTDGQVIIGSTGNIPVAATLTQGSGVTITNGAGTITISAAGAGGTVTEVDTGTGLTGGPITTTGTIALSVPVSAVNGGTGVASPTAHGIMVAEGASAMTPITLSSGQILIGSTGVDPVAAAIGSGTGILVGNGAGSISVALASIVDQRVLANISGGSAAPIANTLTAIIDDCIGSTQGDILYRNATGWVVLAPGTSGQFLQTQGAAANPQWAPGDGSGTVTSVATGTGLAGGTITTTGTISFASIAAHSLWANVTGSSAVPTVIGTNTFIQSVNIQVITATGSSTYTPTTGMVYCIVELVGGGGGGGGASGSAGAGSAAGGGASAGYCRKRYTATLLGATATVVIGTGGGGGSSGANPGSAGADSTFTPAGAGAILTAAGGPAGSAGTSNAAANVSAISSAGGTGTNGDLNIQGQRGSGGWCLATGTLAAGGTGGSTIFGTGGINTANTGNSGGVGGAGYGSGGDGAIAVSANRGGAAGQQGICVITEFIAV